MVKAIATCLVVIVFYAIASIVEAWVLQFLWNWLIVDLTHIREITLWEAFGFCLLLTIVGNAFKSRTSTNKSK